MPVLGSRPRNSSLDGSLRAGFLTRMSALCRAWTSLERTRAAAAKQRVCRRVKKNLRL